MYENQQIPGHNGLERQDIVVVDDTRKTVALENRKAAFKRARQEKVHKYKRVADYFRQKGYKTEVNAFVVGKLGGYCAQNVGALVLLGIGKRYSVLMRKLIVSDTIRWSRDIYVKHVTGHKQYV